MTAPELPPSPLELAHALNDTREITASDTGNVKLFVRRYHNTVRYSPELEQWFIWSGTHWPPDVLGQVFELTERIVSDVREIAMSITDEGNRNRMLAWASATESEGARRRIISMARSNPKIVVRATDIDVPDGTVVTPGGVIDLATGATTLPDPHRMCTACASVPLEEDAQSQRLDDYLASFLPDERKQHLLFAVLGHALYGGNAARVMPVLIGPSSSGKSMIVNAVMRTLGNYTTSINASVFRGNMDDRPRPDLIQALRSRIAFAHEASDHWELHADQVKKLTGGDVIAARQMHSRVVMQIRPAMTPFIVTNAMPHIKGGDEALRRRLLVVNFEHSLPSDIVDPAVQRRFVDDPAVQRTLLARIVAGARSDLMAVAKEAEIEGEISRVFDAVDNVSEFIDWAQEEGLLRRAGETYVAVQCIQASRLHAWYGEWVRKHGEHAERKLSMRAFGRALRARGWESTMSGGTRWLGWLDVGGKL